MQHRPVFPSVADLPNLAPDDAEHALGALRKLERAEVVDVYASAGSNDTRWNVWSNIQWRRIPLQEWETQWLADQDTTPPDDDGGQAA